MISTHHWSAASLKFSNVQTTVALTELLYQAAPMYHLNPEEFSHRKKALLKQYKVFTLLHRITATLPLTSFEWLRNDGTVQRTRFGSRVQVTANFGAMPFTDKDSTVPPGGIAYIVDGKSGEYVPAIDQ